MRIENSALEKMKKTFRILSLLSAVFSAFLFVAIGYFDSIIPDSFYVSGAGKLRLNSVKYVEVRASGAESPAMLERDTQSELMLLGIFPIKTVTASRTEPVQLLAGGTPFGIKLEANGAVAVDFFEIDGRCPARECGLTEGDIIISAGGKEIHSNQSFADSIMKSGGEPIELIIDRNGEKMNLRLTAILDDGTYRAGVEIRDSSAGIGTITFYEPMTKMFAGLGHPVCDSTTGEIFPCGKGLVAPVEITGIRKSENGDPGELQGIFTNSKPIGSIVKNCEEGVYGMLTEIPTDRKSYPLGFKQDISLGAATVISTLGDETQEYSIEIEDINLTDSGTRNMVIRVTDERLLSEAGGIVQGMSGSPIIQDGKIIGAVTHVFVKDTTGGYAIFSEKMYDELLSCRMKECAYSQLSDAA